METHFFDGPAAFRKWLEQNHQTATEVGVGFYRARTGKNTMTWSEAVDQALCFGWIDGVRRSLDAERMVLRFTPRRARSTWSAVNVRKVAELTAAGLMQPAGQAAFARRDPDQPGYSYETRPQDLPVEYRRVFEAEPDAWAFFSSQPPGYRRSATHWVVSAKRPQTRASRLATLMEDSRAGRRIALLAR